MGEEWWPVYLTKFDCGDPVEIDEEPRHHLVIANEFVRAFAVEIAPGDHTLCHHHPHDYLLYVASDAEIISAARDEEPKRLTYQDGDCELSPAGLTHVVENLGGKPFRNVVIELLPASAKLRRNAPPNAAAEIAPLLDEAPGAIFSITMPPGCEVEVSGPVVLASPYDHALILKELDDFDIPLDSFRKLLWVCAPRKVTVKNFGVGLARLIAFQVGHRTERLAEGARSRGLEAAAETGAIEKSLNRKPESMLHPRLIEHDVKTGATIGAELPTSG